MQICPKKEKPNSLHVSKQKNLTHTHTGDLIRSVCPALETQRPFIHVRRIPSVSIIQVIRNPRPEKPRSPFPPALCVFPGFSLPTCLSLLPGLLFMKQVPKAPVRTQTESLSSCERSPPQTGPSSPAPRCPAHHSAGFLRRSTELERARERRPALCTCRKGWYRNHRTGVMPSASFPSVTVCRSPVCGLLPRAQEGRGGEWHERGAVLLPPDRREPLSRRPTGWVMPRGRRRL